MALIGIFFYIMPSVMLSEAVELVAFHKSNSLYRVTNFSQLYCASRTTADRTSASTS